MELDKIKLFLGHNNYTVPWKHNGFLQQIENKTFDNSKTSFLNLYLAPAQGSEKWIA